MLKKFNLLIYTGVLLLFCLPRSLAENIEAKVLNCTEREIKLALSAEGAFKIGDAVDVVYIMGIMGESLIGTYKVKALNKNVLDAEVIRSVMPANQGMNVVVYPSIDQPIINDLFSKDYGKRAVEADTTGEGQSGRAKNLNRDFGNAFDDF